MVTTVDGKPFSYEGRVAFWFWVLNLKWEAELDPSRLVDATRLKRRRDEGIEARMANSGNFGICATNAKYT